MACYLDLPFVCPFHSLVPCRKSLITKRPVRRTHSSSIETLDLPMSFTKSYVGLAPRTGLEFCDAVRLFTSGAA